MSAQPLAKYSALFHALSLRERVLVTLTLLSMTWGVWLYAFGGQVMDERAAAATQVQRITQQLKDTATSRNANSDAIALQLQFEQSQLQRLEDEVSEQQHKLSQLYAGFVPPSDMALMLEDLLTQHRDLELVSLTSKPPLMVLSDAGSDSASQAQVFRHPIVLELRGGFAATQAYIEALERGHWKLSWRRLEYRVEQYPVALVLVELETFSQSEEWIRV